MAEILILFFSAAFSIDCTRLSVVQVAGISRITSFRCFSSTSILARTTIRPLPSSYSETSIVPPSRKSGYSRKGSPRSSQICASRSSRKLCGMIVVAMPTAMPSLPSISRLGILTGSTTGSRLRPS